MQGGPEKIIFTAFRCVLGQKYGVGYPEQGLKRGDNQPANIFFLQQKDGGRGKSNKKKVTKVVFDK